MSTFEYEHLMLLFLSWSEELVESIHSSNHQTQSETPFIRLCRDGGGITDRNFLKP